MKKSAGNTARLLLVFSGGIDDRPGVFEAFFREGKYRLFTFDNPLLLDQDAFIGRNLASSFAPRPEQENYALFKKALTGLFARYEKDGALTFPNITRCYLGRV